MQGRGAGAEGQGAGRADPVGDLALEGVDMGAERGDPTRAHGVEDVTLFDLGHLGLGHEDALGHAVGTSWLPRRPSALM